MGNATLGGRWSPEPKRETTPEGELETIRLSAAVHWRREYAIRPPGPRSEAAILALIEVAPTAELKAELEGHLIALRRALDPFNAP